VIAVAEHAPRAAALPRQQRESEIAMRHWNLARDAEGIARLTLDREGASANTLGAPVIAELNEALDTFERDPPRGLVIASGKSSGFIAGADVDEFKAIERGRGARDRAPRLGHSSSGCRRRLSDGGADPRLLSRRRPGARACVPLSRGRRRARHAPGPA
jgi:hypothetical protein